MYMIFFIYLLKKKVLDDGHVGCNI